MKQVTAFIEPNLLLVVTHESVYDCLLLLKNYEGNGDKYVKLSACEVQMQQPEISIYRVHALEGVYEIASFQLVTTQASRSIPPKTTA